MTLGKLRRLRDEARKLRNVLYRRLYVTRGAEERIVDLFHRLYWDSHMFGRTWGDTHWLGIQILKCPLDLWIYQELVFELKPDVIIECGTKHGGSALFLASMCDLVDRGTVVTVDIEAQTGRPAHKRIQYLLGSSVSPEIVDQVRRLALGAKTVMVLLDSDHHKPHVLQELKTYSEFVTKGSYLIVEDTNMNGYPINPTFGPGPMEAVEEFLRENDEFLVDRSREKFYLTFNPGGYLKRQGRAFSRTDDTGRGVVA